MKYTNQTRKTAPFTLKAVLLGGLALSLPLGAIAQDAQNTPADKNAQSSKDANASPGLNLSKVSDDSYLSLNGTVQSVAPHSFTLSYNNGEDQILVEMDDGDRDADAYSLLAGDKVTVYGVMDRDLFESGKIEASSVYVDKINTFFYASAVDEEDYYYYPLMTVVTVAPTDSSSSQSGSSTSSTGANAQSNSGDSQQMDATKPVLWLQGEVSDVKNDSFSLAMGDTDISVTLDNLSDNPLDADGYGKIEAGDVVSVRGNIDSGFFENSELAAASVVKIHDQEALSEDR